MLSCRSFFGFGSGAKSRVNKSSKRRKNKSHALPVFLDVKASQQHDCLIPKQATIRRKGLVHAATVDSVSAIRIVRSDVRHAQSGLTGLHQYRQNDRWSSRSRQL